jgi:hypothetical protein
MTKRYTVKRGRRSACEYYERDVLIYDGVSLLFVGSFTGTGNLTKQQRAVIDAIRVGVERLNVEKANAPAE